MAVAAGAAGPRLASAQQTHKWKMQSLWQAGSVNQKVFEDWAKRVKEASGGRIEIEPLAVGTIVGYGETLDALSNGVLDSHHSGGPYFSGQGAGAGAHRRPERRLREPVPDADVVRVRRRPRAGARDLPAVQRLLRGPGLVGRGVGAGQEAAPDPGRLQGREDARAGRPRRRDLAARGRRRRHPAGQRGVHGARAGRDRGDRLGHARHEQRPRLPPDREVPAASRLPLHAGGRGGGEHDPLERALARPQGLHGDGGARLRARDGAADRARGPEGGRAGPGPGRRAGELDAGRAEALPAGSRSRRGPTGRRRAPPRRRSTTARSRSCGGCGCSTRRLAAPGPRAPGRAALPPRPCPVPDRRSPVAVDRRRAEHPLPGRRRAHLLRGRDALRLQRADDLGARHGDRAERRLLRRRRRGRLAAAEPHPDGLLRRPGVAALCGAGWTSSATGWPPSTSRMFLYGALRFAIPSVQLMETSGRAWDVPIPAFLKSVLAIGAR